jgi:hypothetical protein
MTLQDLLCWDCMLLVTSQTCAKRVPVGLCACSLVHLLNMPAAVAAAASADAGSFGGPWGGSNSFANAAASGEQPQHQQPAAALLGR